MFDKRREHPFEVAFSRHASTTTRMVPPPPPPPTPKLSSTYSLYVSSPSSLRPPQPPPPRPTSLSNEIYGNLLELESAFLRPKHWQSSYVKKMTYRLSVQASRKHHQLRESSNFAQHQHSSSPFQSSFQQQHQQKHQLPQYNPIRPPYFTTATRIDRQPSNTLSTSAKMISAEHQFSTIKTQYSEQRKAFVSEVSPMRPMLVQVEFEVFGELSGVFFTKYAKGVCENLNLKGWIRVSPRGSIYGQIQGEKDKVDEMVIWLRSQGSPNSKITGCQFRNWRIIDSCDFRNMTLRY